MIRHYSSANALGDLNKAEVALTKLYASMVQFLWIIFGKDSRLQLYLAHLIRHAKGSEVEIVSDETADEAIKQETMIRATEKGVLSGAKSMDFDWGNDLKRMLRLDNKDE